MTPRTDIAVVLPSYNPGEEIAWTLESFRAQTVPFKLFVVDDGSVDKPDYATLLAGFDHELIELAENVGPNTVRNPAVQRALDQGYDYVAQMDCGDWSFPTRLEDQRRFLDAHPEISLVGSAAAIHGNDGHFAYTYMPPQTSEDIRTALFYGTTFKHPAMMVRASLWREIGPYSDEFAVAEDYELARRAAAVAELANLPQTLLKVVESRGGVSARRRHAQLFSRLRIQWRYRDLRSPHFWLGAARTLLSMVIPASVLRLVRPLVSRSAATPSGAPVDRHPSGGVDAGEAVTDRG